MHYCSLHILDEKKNIPTLLYVHIFPALFFFAQPYLDSTQYGNMGFEFPREENTKLETVLAKNQYFKRKLLYFVN